MHKYIRKPFFTGSTLHCMTKNGRPSRELPASFAKFEFVNE